MANLSIQRPPVSSARQGLGPSLPSQSYGASPAASPAKSVWSRDAILACAGLGLVILGFAAKTTDLWLLWLGLPTAIGLLLYLCLPAIRRHRGGGTWQDQRSELLCQWSQVVENLSQPADKRYKALHLRVSRLGDLFPNQGQNSLLRPGEYMLWLYLKLLLARDHLEESVRSSHEDQITAQREALLAELDSEALTESTRQSKQETLLILDQRILTIRNRAGRIQEIESDITRVEQWVALMHDQAAQQNTMGDAGRQIHFTPDSLSLPSLKGTASASIQQLDLQINSQAFR